MSNSVHLIEIQSTAFLRLCCVWKSDLQIMIYDKNGNRKYLTAHECGTFLRAAGKRPPHVEMLCILLVYTGVRISEALALTLDHLDSEIGVVVVESLKKRKKGVYRYVPVPTTVLDRLQLLAKCHDHHDNTGGRIWPWCRTTAWAHIKAVMKSAGIPESRAMPKTLRHTFGVGAIQASVPINVLQKWLGHSRLTTTAIYADAVGAEERNLARRVWKSFAAD